PAPGAARSVAVLDLLARHPEERFTLSEVARRCSLNKATAHALLTALTEHGILLRHPDEKRYSLGPRLVEIGDAARQGYSVLDFVPAIVSELVADTGLAARALQMMDTRIVAVADTPVDGDGTGQVRLPLVPPVGAVFMAWADEPTLQAWLARATAAEGVRAAVEALPSIRRLGYGVVLASAAWARLTTPVQRQERHGDHRALLAEIARRPFLLRDIEPDASYEVAGVEAPVFGPSGDVAVVLGLVDLDDRPRRGSEVRALGARVAAAADELTRAIRGRRPPVPGSD